ncbi:MAG TPA: type II secretion system F family protein [Alphaproteobacteria bacterium]|nr:type II secretion system F family protein [Alphaproteobacteria bacterium]
MTSLEVNFIPILIGILVVAGYVFFIFFYRYREGTEKVIDWQRRLNEIGAFSQKEKEEALSLLKDQGSPDTYFKSKLPRVEGLRQWIQHAGLNINPAVFIALSFLVGLSIFLVFSLLWRVNLLLSCLIGAVFSFILPWLFIAILTNRRKKEFLNEFPIALDVIRRALRAGYSSDRALAMVSEQQKGPIGKIFNTISDKMRLGESPEAVLGDMANRLGIDEFRMLAIVLVLQRETGGSLAEATDNFAKIIRSRQSLRKKVKALSAEVRVTAMILAALPFFILGSVYFTSPHYLDPLFYTDRGHTLLIIGGVMLFLGIGIMIRMAYKDIY